MGHFSFSLCHVHVTVVQGDVAKRRDMDKEEDNVLLERERKTNCDLDKLCLTCCFITFRSLIFHMSLRIKI